MDGKLLEILCCPVSRRPVSVLDIKRRDALRAAIGKGEVLYVDDETVAEAFDDVLVTDDEKVLYLVVDGIPVMLENFSAGQL